VSPMVAALAERVADEKGAALVVAPEDPGEQVRLHPAGRFQRRNFALAITAAEAFLGHLDPERVADVGASIVIPGRLERLSERPAVFVDAAHNAEGAAALAESLPEIAAGRPVIACLAMLGDKDAATTIGALAPILDRAVCTELPTEPHRARGRPGAVSHPADELARACDSAGLTAAVEPDFAAAVVLGCKLAAEAGGILLVSGSHYVLSPARRAVGLCED